MNFMNAAVLCYCVWFSYRIENNSEEVDESHIGLSGAGIKVQEVNAFIYSHYNQLL